MKKSNRLKLLDCTLRDGGYYNAWNFPLALIEEYLVAMKAAHVDVVELGFRFLKNEGFKGPCAFTTDEFLDRLAIPPGLAIGVMLNGSDLCKDLGCVKALERLFPRPASQTQVQLVRIACHFHELPMALPAAEWLAERGYCVGFNLMQIADRSRDEVIEFTRMASSWPIEVLYFADSMGSMKPEDIVRITGWLREGWEGSLGIHTHDNMGMALTNTLSAHSEGVSWIDATVTGMGRGAGNARTEDLVLELEDLLGRKSNLVPLMTLIRNYFGPMKANYGWGTNAYYYYAGKYGIHPSYVQEMQGDSRYDDADIIAVLDHLRSEGGTKYSLSALHIARNYYKQDVKGSWCPSLLMKGRDVVILGTGPGVLEHRLAIEAYVKRSKPVVLALNTQSAIDSDLISLRIACHPVRLLADVTDHAALPQPLITPASMLPESLRMELKGKDLLDYGILIDNQRFEFHPSHCVAPASLVLAYSLAVATSGNASRILMAGFDGYPAGDPRHDETASILDLYQAHAQAIKILAITPTRHRIPAISIYATSL
jgi:4-hydroxy 2-oxovalerate aldolase